MDPVSSNGHAATHSNGQKSALDFINWTADHDEARQGDIRTMWSQVWSSLTHCGAVLHMDRDAITCSGNTVGWGKRKFVPSLLRAAVHLEWWKLATDQGRSVTCVSAHPARLNLLPTSTTRKQAGERVSDLSCPGGCTEQETLAHVLNHCPSLVGLLHCTSPPQQDPVTASYPAWKGRQFLEQVIPDDTQGLKPDITILNEASKEAFIVDVTMPFVGAETFQAVRN
ncbi:hypothetical protein EMCRGX_G005351 [Ephydatia muelleri]